MRALDKADFKFPAIWKVYDYWLSKVTDGGFVRRTDINPRELRDCLRYLLLIDVTQNPVSFRFGLSAQVWCNGRELITPDLFCGMEIMGQTGKEPLLIFVKSPIRASRFTVRSKPPG
jgi:hypothetical protein